MTRPMMNPESKRALKGMVLSLRELLEGEFDPDTYDPVHPGGDVVRQLARLGIDPDRPASMNSDAAPSYLSAEEKTIRDRICAAIRRQASLFGDPSQAKPLKRGFRAYVRETTYTWINRLLGLKCMEVRGLLRDAHGEPDFVVTPSEQYGGLPRRAWRIKGQDPVKWQQARVHDLLCAAIADAFAQLTRDIGILFDPESPHGLIWPSPQALAILLQKLQGLEAVPSPFKGEGQGGGGPYASHDFLGWVYQYFQTKEKDQVFEAASKKKRKIEKDDIIPATQIYTEEYMVAYLVQNTLGRLWMEMHPDSNLAGNWDYYVKPPEGNAPVEREAKNAIDLKLMDPALGGGHFHLAGFDLLLEMYLEEMENAGKPGWPDAPSVASRSEIPRAIIEHNLYGIDIDARAVQIATLALYLKAREAGYDGPIKAFHFVVANAAPFDSPSWHEFIKTVHDKGSYSAARVLAALSKQLKNLDEFGSLLRIEEDLQKVIREETGRWVYRKGGGGEPDVLFAEMARPRQQTLSFEKEITDETYFAETLSPSVEKELDDFYRSARQKGLAEAAILASDADRGFDFLRLCMERYDVVYTNPPYMGSKNMGKQLKDFVARAYPEGKRDLYAAFILRCLELAEPNGYVGMVTQQSWMFLRSFSDLRAMPEEKLQKAGNAFKGLLRETAIETIAHLGPHAFSEIGGEVVNIVLFTLRKALPAAQHRMTAFRLIGPKTPEEKLVLLKSALAVPHKGMVFEPNQFRYLGINESPLCYWLNAQLFEVFAGNSLGDIARVVQGLATADDPRFVRFFWEIHSWEWAKDLTKRHWVPFEKGGGYGRWFGHQWWVVDWENGGQRIKNTLSPRVQNEKYYLKEGWSYSSLARGSISVRYMNGCIWGAVLSDAVFAIDGKYQDMVAHVLNCHFSSACVRWLRSQIVLSGSYVSRIPIPRTNFSVLPSTRLFVALRAALISSDPSERNFNPETSRFALPCRLSDAESAACLLHGLEGWSERLVFRAYGFEEEATANVLSETGIPSGWYPLLSGYDRIPKSTEILPPLPEGFSSFLEKLSRCEVTSDDLGNLKHGLAMLYEAGPGSKIDYSGMNDPMDADDDSDTAIGSYIPIPPETFLEELSQKLQIHPISVYWLLKEMREKEGLRCPPEEKRHAEEYVSVMIIRMLGYQWPKQVEAGEPLPEWADEDGIIPLGEGLGEPSLLDRVRERFGADFGVEKEASIEAEFGNIVGKPLGRWLGEDFFERHVKQFKSRPIAWHIVSDPSVVDVSAGDSGKGKRKGAKKKRSPAFSVLVHYHRFVDGEKGYRMLQLLRNKYLQRAITQTRMELEGLRGRGADPGVFERIAELDRRMIELEDFRDKLERIQEGKDREARIYVRWKSREEQPKGWRPDINDGVKINIAPWERLGMFPVKKIVGKVEMGE